MSALLESYAGGSWFRAADEGKPLLDASTGEEVARISATGLDLSAMVDHVEVLTVDQITLVLRDERIVVWGSSDDSATKAEVLLQLLRQPAKVYDVSVPGQPTTCPESSAEACLRQP